MCPAECFMFPSGKECNPLFLYEMPCRYQLGPTSPMYGTNELISHTCKVMLKILQARLQQYVNHELPDVQAGFRKGRGTKIQIANIH